MQKKLKIPFTHETHDQRIGRRLRELERCVCVSLCVHRYIFFEDVSSKSSALTWIQEVVAIVGSQVRNRSYFCFYLRVFFNRWTVWSILCLYFNIL